MTEKTGTPAPAAESSAPAVAPPSERREVDLSDLQAELDSQKDQADEDEIFNDIAGKGKDGDPEDADDEDDADPADEAVEGEDEEKDDDTDAEDKPRKRTRGDRYRDQIARRDAEIELLRSQIDMSRLTGREIEEYVQRKIGPIPQEKNFDNYLEYERKAIAWQVRHDNEMQIALEVKERAKEKHVEHLRELVEDHEQRVDGFKNRNGEESVKDYDTVMAKAQKMMVSPVVEVLILESPKSAHLQYFFARNPPRLEKINRMSATHAAKEIAYIEQRLSLPQPRTKTAAPPPKPAPKGGAGPTSQEAMLNAWGKKKYGSNW